MENASLPTDVWNDVTTASDDLSLNLTSIHDLALKVVYIIIGAIGVLDNLFVIIVFILYIKLTEKVLQNKLHVVIHLNCVCNTVESMIESISLVHV